MSRTSRAAPTLHQRLIALAEAAVIEDGPDAALSTREQRLANVVVRSLRQGRDQPVLDAIAALDEQHAHKAADLLTFWADDAAQTLEIQVTSPEGPVPGTATFVLIPFFISRTGPDPLPLDLRSHRQFDPLVKSLRAHHLIGPGPTLYLCGGFYRLADVSTSWAARRDWLQQVVREAAGQPASVPPPTPEPLQNWPVQTVHMHLRFVVGVVIAAGDDDSVTWNQLERPPLADDAMEETLEGWRADVGALMLEMLESPAVVPGDPGLWTDAVQSGIELWNEMVSAIMLDGHCRAANATPDRVLADIRWTEKDAAWQVALSSPALTSAPWRWLVAEDPIESRDDLADFLRHQGIRRFAWDEHGVPD